MTETTQRLIGLIGEGHENAISRTDLLGFFGGSDRQMRMAISMARLEGVCINNDQDGAGYYRPTAQDEIRRQYKQTLNRARTIFAQLKALRAELGIEGQMTLADLEGETDAV